jgi:hypothetical protein
LLILAASCKVIGKGVITQLSDPFTERPYWPIDWSNFGRGHVLSAYLPRISGFYMVSRQADWLRFDLSRVEIRGEHHFALQTCSGTAILLHPSNIIFGPLVDSIATACRSRGGFAGNF